MKISQFSGTITNQANKFKKAAMVASAVIPMACGNITTHSPVAPELTKAVDTAFGEFVGNIYSKEYGLNQILCIAAKRTENSQYMFAPIEGPAAGFVADSKKVAESKKYYQDISPKYTRTIGNFFAEARKGNKEMTDTSSNTVRRWFNAIEDKNMYVININNPSKVSCVRLTEVNDTTALSKSIINDLVPNPSEAAVALLPRDSLTIDYLEGKYTPSKKHIFGFCLDGKGFPIDAQGKLVFLREPTLIQ